MSLETSNQIDEFNNLKSSLKYNSSLYKRKVSDNPEAFSLSKKKQGRPFIVKRKIEKKNLLLMKKSRIRPLKKL